MPKVTPTKSSSAAVKQLSTGVRKSKSTPGELPSAWDMIDRMSIVLYGRSGTGKTTLWATWPGPILAIVISGGRQPGELRSIATPEYRKKINARIANNCDDVAKLIDEGANYATVVLDHATGLQDLRLKEILGKDDLPPQLSWGLASQQEYGKLALHMKETFRALLNLPGNVVIVAQERNFNDESDSEIIRPFVAAALTPSIVGWLHPACDYICQTYIRAKVDRIKQKVGGNEVYAERPVLEPGTGRQVVEYCLRTAPHPTYATKFRVPRGTPLPECIVDPSYDKIVQLIEGN